MKTFITFLLGFCIGWFIIAPTIKYYSEPKVDLPEEYKLIDKTDVLRGYFDRDSTLVIEFENAAIKPEYTLEIISNDSVYIQSGGCSL